MRDMVSERMGDKWRKKEVTGALTTGTTPCHLLTGNLMNDVSQVTVSWYDETSSEPMDSTQGERGILLST